jgi:hypothetical protein
LRCSQLKVKNKNQEKLNQVLGGIFEILCLARWSPSVMRLMGVGSTSGGKPVAVNAPGTEE